MVTYLANAFSLGMLKYNTTLIEVKKITVDEAKYLLQQKGFVSAIGHEGTAQLLTKLLGMPVQMNRIQVKAEAFDTIVVFQLLQRLPEGAVLNEEQLKTLQYEFYLVKVRWW